MLVSLQASATAPLLDLLSVFIINPYLLPHYGRREEVTAILKLLYLQFGTLLFICVYLYLDHIHNKSKYVPSYKGTLSVCDFCDPFNVTFAKIFCVVKK